MLDVPEFKPIVIAGGGSVGLTVLSPAPGRFEVRVSERAQELRG